MYFRVQLGFPADSALPRDVMTINPHYSGDNAEALANAIKANLVAKPATASKPFTIKVYDASKPPPSYPLYELKEKTGFSTVGIPRELALCLSLYATVNRPSYRGRLYIPMFLIGSTLGLRPTQASIDECATWAQVLGAGLPPNHALGIWSRKLQKFEPVTDWWVDDEWDIIRSRGLRPVTRKTGTL